LLLAGRLAVGDGIKLGESKSWGLRWLNESEAGFNGSSFLIKIITNIKFKFIN
jgi:hypothetical protein